MKARVCETCHTELVACASCGDLTCECPGAKASQRSVTRWRQHYEADGRRRVYANKYEEDSGVGRY